MGLYCSHESARSDAVCWRGPYTAFHRWRRTVAKAAGYPPLDLMAGFYNDQLVVGMNARQISDDLPISWDYFTGDPLTLLLCHADDRGVLLASDCAKIADRLTEILPKLPPQEEDPHADDTRQFIVGLRAAAAAGENVEFS